MRLVLLSLLLVAPAAHAAPVIVAIAAAVGASTAVLAVIQIGLAIGMAVYGSAKQRKAARKARDAYNAALQDRTVTRVATEAPHVYAYGATRVGSAIVAMLPSGAKDEFKHLVCVHASHECQAIDEIYINGKPLGPLDGSGGVTTGDFVKVTLEAATQFKTVTDVDRDLVLDHVPHMILHIGGQSADAGPYPYTIADKTITFSGTWTGPIFVQYGWNKSAPLVRVQKHLGGASDPVDAYLFGLMPDKWPATSVLRGHCYTVVTLDLNEPEFQGGPPAITVDLRGAKLYDPRTGTTVYSRNPALVAYHYLTSEMCGIPAADLPIADFITAANVCDEVIRTDKARYQFDGTINADQPQAGVLEKIAESMAGGIVSTTWSIYAGKYIAPVMALDQSDIVAGLAVAPGISDADLFNGVRGQFFNGEVATDFAPYQNAAYLAADGREKWTNVDFPFTSDNTWVHDLCRIFTEDQRNAYTIKAGFSLKAWKLKVGQRVTMTSSVFGWTNKIFRITDRKFSPSSPVELTLKEDAASIWDLADAVVIDATPNSDLPNPFYVAPLASVTLESGTDSLLTTTDGTIVSRILAIWPQATTGTVVNGGAIEIEWQQANSLAWQKTSVAGDETSTYLSPAQDGRYYIVRARAANPTMGVHSNWVYADAHQVIGKTEPPPPVDRFKVIEQPGGVRQFYWDMDSPPPDLFAFEVRYSIGTTERPWAEMIPLFAKDRNARQHETTEPLNDGVYTFAVCAVDTTDNLSAPVYTTEVLDGGAFGAVLKIVLPHEDSWPGAKTDCYLDGTTLTADGVTTWDDLDISWDDTEETWSGGGSVSPISYEHTTIDLGAILEITLRANSLSAGAALIEVSSSDDGAAYSTWEEVPSASITARYYKVRWTVSGTAPLMYRAQAIFYS